MRHVTLGSLEVSRIGLGAMGMSTAYVDRSVDESQAIATIHRALELGVTFIDTAEVYGPYTNEELDRARAAEPARPGRPGHQVRHDLARRRWPGTSRQLAREHPDRRRGVAAAARHRPHRPLLPTPSRPDDANRGDRRRPGELVAEGKVRHIGLSEASAETIRRAHAVHRDHRPPVRVLAVDPRPRGHGACRSSASSASASCRTRPWAAGCSRAPSVRSTSSIRRISDGRTPASPGRTSAPIWRASRKSRRWPARPGRRPAQVALAWLLAQGDDIAPIPGPSGSPGSRRTRRGRVQLTAAQLSRLDNLRPASGEHHNEEQMRWIER